ncbi:hypothetical protein ACFTWH_18580 [Streptomyces sp. NPDC057011]|uniref:hypothetical protein n=1 Tax=unclassified Streptomyces TaxID=2593676 RepID=UPI00363E6890
MHAVGGGIGITVESAPGHQPPGLRMIPLTGPSTTADQVVLTPLRAVGHGHGTARSAAARLVGVVAPT